jgi:hypothetical protein
MAKSGVMTLLSDFGTKDPYVGVMKGAIAQVNPRLTVIDLTHEIPPQAIAQARFALISALPYFPGGTVHVAVVDPGVGGDRRPIAVALGHDPNHPVSILVGPDNGIFSALGNQYPVLSAVELTNPRCWRSPVPSRTFHGRDIFAPVGAHLASGVAFSQVGREIDPATLIQLERPIANQTGNTITGLIQAIDRFGNLITTIPARAVAGREWSLQSGGWRVVAGQTYGDRPPGEVLALVGSHGWVEVAVNGGNAQVYLGLDIGAVVEVVLQE